MTVSVVDHLSTGGRQLIMLNPLGAPVPESLAGINALFIDRENTGLALLAARKRIDQAKALGLFSVLRCDGLGSHELRQCAQLSPDAIVLPQIVSAAQAATCLALLRNYSVPAIPQIETKSAISDLNGLMALDVAGFLIGPNDLAADMGKPDAPEHADVAAAVESVAGQLAAAGHSFGLPTLTTEAYTYWTGRGAQLCYVTTDALADMKVAS